MRAHTFTLLLLCCVVASAQDTNTASFTPVEKFGPIEKALVEQGSKTAQADFAAACVNLARDVQDKRITVYAHVFTAKPSVTNESGFKIEVIYHPALAQNYDTNVPSYSGHYNSCLLDFALAQCAEGKKELGTRLVRMLADLDPQLSWSSPQIQPTNIKKILAALEADDGSLAEMMKEAVSDWHWREKAYQR